MKKITTAVCIFILGSLSAQQTSGKVVVSKDGKVQGRFVSETSTKY